MTNKFGHFIPYKRTSEPHINIDFANKTLCKTYSKNNPFFNICNEDSTVHLFLEALKKNHTEEAKKYISKNFLDKIDLCDLKDFFTTNLTYKNLTKINFFDTPNNCKTNSMLFIGSDNNSSIINLHMICEPDNISKWKIYAVDKECDILS